MSAKKKEKQETKTYEETAPPIISDPLHGYVRGTLVN